MDKISQFSHRRFRRKRPASQPCKVCGGTHWCAFRSSKSPIRANRTVGSKDDALYHEVNRILTDLDHKSENPFHECQHLIPFQHLALTPRRRAHKRPELLRSQKPREKRHEPSRMNNSLSGDHGITQPTTATEAARPSRWAEFGEGICNPRQIPSVRERQEGIKRAVEKQTAKESQQSEDLELIPGLDL